MGFDGSKFGKCGLASSSSFANCLTEMSCSWICSPLPADFHGYPNATFALLSDKAHQLNSRFGNVAVVGGTFMQSIGLKHGRDEVEVRPACISGLGMLCGIADVGNKCWQLLKWPSCLPYSTCATCACA